MPLARALRTREGSRFQLNTTTRADPARVQAVEGHPVTVDLAERVVEDHVDVGEHRHLGVQLDDRDPVGVTGQDRGDAGDDEGVVVDDRHPDRSAHVVVTVVIGGTPSRWATRPLARTSMGRTAAGP